MAIIKDATSQSIQQAQDILRNDGVIGLPTETVYGLAGNAFSDTAIQKIYAIKNRPAFNPLIIHYAVPPVIDNDLYKNLAQSFWPGPLTIIVDRALLPDSQKISTLATAGLNTVAIRVPSHPVAHSILSKLDFPLAAPSANRSGSMSPTTPMHVANGLGDDVDMILAAGRTDVGLESSVIHISGDELVMLRHGAITPDDISDRIGINVSYLNNSEDIKSPGQLLKHYAPKTPLRLHAVDVGPNEALLGFGSLKFMSMKNGGNINGLPDDHVRNLSESGDLNEAAYNLFYMLQELDRGGAERIAVMDIPAKGIGLAIRDRLARAAQS